MTTNQITQEGIDLIKRFEEYRLTPYLCPAKVLTVGYGHTGLDIIKGVSITPEQAEGLLREDLEEAAGGVIDYVMEDINDNQFSALVSFVFNLGAGALHGSTLLRKLNDGDVNGAALEFLKWDHANGVELAGLLARRKAERELFLKLVEA